MIVRVAITEYTYTYIVYTCCERRNDAEKERKNKRIVKNGKMKIY